MFNQLDIATGLIYLFQTRPCSIRSCSKPVLFVVNHHTAHVSSFPICKDLVLLTNAHSHHSDVISIPVLVPLQKVIES